MIFVNFLYDAIVHFYEIEFVIWNVGVKWTWNESIVE